MSDPVRTCILAREEAPREGLIRLALSPDGDVLPDVRAKAPGRGAWIGVARAELESAQAKGKLKGALSRAFKTGDIRIPDDLGARITAQLERQLLDRLGLEFKAGHVVIGGERIQNAARSGQLHLLLHASDAGADGAGKLAQAWRVGSDAEGSGKRGLTLPLSRTILSLALGRENVVHAGVTDAKAAGRVSDVLGRWLHFIGPELGSSACESASQGASALPQGSPPHDERLTEGLRRPA
ncbi:DUF448 domain-containing protein [Sphingomonas sp. IC-56]|uniref:DUF448 domain-containing protein n=1 Tax=Sphingomonas sp. IC-56 TaxID=2898529 RepID=UPI001E342444|nr:DUF448 domain-containing protein [Sphingomonas sp. IC-56]